MEWELWWNGECIDVTYTREYAETLRYEYQMAFGNSHRVTIRKVGS
jgi:hypothetical protein